MENKFFQTQSFDRPGGDSAKAEIQAHTIKSFNKSYFDYQVWQTDHPFTNKRVALIKMVLSFLDR
jgi:hypothetical protein